MLDYLIFGAAADVMSEIDIVMTVIPAITTKFVVGAVYAADDVLTVLVTELLPAFGIDMLAGENASGLVTVMTSLEFKLSSLWGRILSFGRAAFA